MSRALTYSSAGWLYSHHFIKFYSFILLVGPWIYCLHLQVIWSLLYVQGSICIIWWTANEAVWRCQQSAWLSSGKECILVDEKDCILMLLFHIILRHSTGSSICASYLQQHHYCHSLYKKILIHVFLILMPVCLVLMLLFLTIGCILLTCMAFKT